ncbi:hypothetical protein IMZ48_33615 [Candidatus Bathyarchaeota archaeon]|nr:hypothetical protein [Candidatus Bathyarchaeota archaeon]
MQCDEGAPCSSCEKRRERCSLAGAVDANKPLTPTASPPPPRELDPLANIDARVNLLHMELFHHFSQVTIHTLAFENTWSELVKLAFHVSPRFRQPIPYFSLNPRDIEPVSEFRAPF